MFCVYFTPAEPIWNEEKETNRGESRKISACAPTTEFCIGYEGYVSDLWSWSTTMLFSNAETPYNGFWYFPFLYWVFSYGNECINRFRDSRLVYSDSRIRYSIYRLRCHFGHDPPTPKFQDIRAQDSARWHLLGGRWVCLRPGYFCVSDPN